MLFARSRSLRFLKIGEIEVLVLVEAGEDEEFLAGVRIRVPLQSLAFSNR